ncbi:hypothetical protein QUF72_12275 [Desulfobacterales bacterium HSG2]|nr:hypothetical protein [Desulfobacterales bacterium HSG2]
MVRKVALPVLSVAMMIICGCALFQRLAQAPEIEVVGMTSDTGGCG